jgi:predicted dehydrogenase
MTAISATAATAATADAGDAGERISGNVVGPLLINLVHELDSLRFICGEIREVHARKTAAARGLEVADSLAISMQFESGALGTVRASDATPAACSPFALAVQQSAVSGQPVEPQRLLAAALG